MQTLPEKKSLSLAEYEVSYQGNECASGEVPNILKIFKSPY